MCGAGFDAARTVKPLIVIKYVSTVQISFAEYSSADKCELCRHPVESVLVVDA